MARKKATELHEDQDEASVEAEVTGEGYDTEASDGDDGYPEPLSVEIAPEQPAKPEPELSETTKAEQEAGRQTLAEKAKSRQAEQDNS